ncbi:MAG: Gfo/Idh/MocA family oxidoreductase [Planctomycetota bacterium]|nr:Gfo/Idh/MocA family oxidoreductase [Planctomycetota bacterium]
MSKKLRCAVIGAGAIGLHHIQGFQKHPDAEVAAVAEVNPERRAEAVAKYALPKGVEDYKELLKDKTIDAVSVALPNALHAPVATEAIKAGKHVLLDKPMATNAREAQQIVDAWKEKKVVFMVGQNFRFNPETQKVKAAAAAGELGEIYHGRAHWLRRSGIPRIGSWFTQKKMAGGGCCYDIGVHLLDCLLHIMDNFDAEAVSGVTYAKFGPRGLGDGSWGKGEVDPNKPFEVEDFAGALVRLKGGKSAILEVSWALHAEKGKDHGVDIYGTEAGASLFPAMIHKAQGKEITSAAPVLETLPVPEERMVHFVDCVLKGVPPLVKPEESLKLQKILDAIYESGSTGREVRIA